MSSETTLPPAAATTTPDESAAIVEESGQQARSEIQEYLSVRSQRRRLFPRAILVGLLAGLLAVAFRIALASGDNIRHALLTWAHQYPLFGWIFAILFGITGATLSVFLVRRLAPEAAGSGIPYLEAVLHRYRELNWRRVLGVKFPGGILALGSGLVLGREGPTVQMGGAVGAAVADGLHSGVQDRLVLIASGAGAGLAAAFNAPLAGLIFVLEELQKDFRPVVFGSAFLAAATANIVARFLSGQLPVFHVPNHPVPDLSALPAFACLGIACGLVGVLYNRILIGTLNLFSKIPPGRVLIAAGVVGAIAGLLAWFQPDAVGGGHHLTETVLAGQIALGAIPLWFGMRFVLSMASYGTGAPGGIFAPLLALGALLGLGVGQIAHNIAPHAVPIPAIFAVVGMAAFFTAIVRAPLTGIVLVLEMTGNYEQMLPLLVTCFCAYLVAEALGELPIYENLLQRELLRGGALPEPTDPQILELEVAPGAPFDGRSVRDLGLPPGCILIRCQSGSREWIPTANTRLIAHLRITALVSPEAKGAAEVLRRGCRSEE